MDFFKGTVLLHLFAGALSRRSPSFSDAIPALHIPVPSPFSILEAFIESCIKSYNLDLYNCKPPPERTPPVVQTTKSASRVSVNGAEGDVPRKVSEIRSKSSEEMRRALEQYKKKFPNIAAIIIGTRRTDPHGGKPNFVLSDPFSIIDRSFVI